MRRALIPTAAVLAAVFLSACGQDPSSAEDFEGEERRVAEVVEDFQEAGEEDEAGRICRELLSAEVVRRLRGGQRGCNRTVERSLEEADEFAIEVEDVSISGARATAKVKFDDGDDERTDTLSLVRESGRWRLASLGSS